MKDLIRQFTPSLLLHSLYYVPYNYNSQYLAVHHLEVGEQLVFSVYICPMLKFFKFVYIEEKPKIRITSEKGHENMKTKKN